MSPSPDSKLSKPCTFVCDCKKEYRSACAGEPFYKQLDGKWYCVLHFPRSDKIPLFQEALQRKIAKGGDLDFQGVWFPIDVDFTRFAFLESDFCGAVFNGKAKFLHATFAEGAYFSGSIFKDEANFYAARFERGVNFGATTFKRQTDFTYASFWREVDFTGARFDRAVIFRDAHFGDYARFARGVHPVFSDDSSLDLQFARIEKADRISFHTVTLCPSWFVNVDARGFSFTDVKWNWRTVQDEIVSVRHKSLSPHLTLSTTYRNLALNAEENHRYDEASQFRFRAMDATRLQHWHGFDVRRLSWWYWWASGYGERVLLTAMVLVGVFIISAVLYTQVGFARWEPRLSTEAEAMNAKPDEYGDRLPLARALTYSAAVMTLQKPDPRPATTTAKALVLAETILGPVQAALLALAIRRKFMR